MQNSANPAKISKTIFWVFGFVVLILFCGACSSNSKFSDYHSLIHSTGFEKNSGAWLVTKLGEIDPLVENGNAYEKVSIRLPASIHEIYFPGKTTTGEFVVRESEQRERVDIYLDKRMVFAGHPEKFCSILNKRKEMGIGIRINGGRLTVCSFGGFDSCIEGGWGVNALVLVPKGIRVEKRRSLQFDDIANQRWQGIEHFRPGDWFILPTSPDAGRHAAQIFETHSE